MHEIITLQLGQRSNYVATHFWNAQESYFTYSGDEDSPVDHDVHFRPGLGADGSETFTPRTVIYDLKGAFGSLRKINALYDMQEEQGMPKGLWDGPTIVQQQSGIGQTPYQASLDQGTEPPALTPDKVRYWSDYNRVFYHPRSIVQLNEYELNSSLMPFERWDVGEELFGTLDKEHDLLDRDLRPFAEECDQLQGVQMMTSVDDAWGGFAARYLDRLRDEFGKMSLWVWGLEDGHRLEREKRTAKTVNTIQSLRDVSSQASLYIPVSDPMSKIASYLDVDLHSQWHTSGVISTAIETMTLPSRLKRNAGLSLSSSSSSSSSSLSTMETVLNLHGNQNIARLGMSISKVEDDDAPPHSLHSAQDRDSRVAGQHGNLHSSQTQHLNGASATHLSEYDMDLFPGLPAGTDGHGRRVGGTPHTFTRVEVFRGRDAEREAKDASNEPEEEPERRRGGSGDDPVVQRYRSHVSYPQPDSFPPIFSGVCPRSRAADLRVGTGLSVDSSTAVYLRSLRRTAMVGVARDERETLTNALGELAEAYETGWKSGSDDDDDDE